MRDLVRQIVEGYRSLKLEGQEDGYVVFSGQEPDTRQAVSIKILPRLLGREPQIARRFEALSRAIRQLNHPNIVTVRQVGERAGLPYVVTRAVEKGQPLATRLDQPWAVDLAADVVMQVGQALEHAYNKGVVHGSLAPENVIVQEQGKVLVTDFGLGELMEMVGARATGAGSPFAAPERAGGKPADARADVYSLAAIAYHLLAGRAPQVVRGEVLPPSRFNPEVPAGMDPVLVKALAPDPQNRYPDIKALLAALGGVTLASTVHWPRSPAAVAHTSTGVQTCPRCGAANQSGRFCRKCGTALLAAQPRPQSRPQGQPVPQPKPQPRPQSQPPTQPKPQGQPAPQLKPQPGPQARSKPQARPAAPRAESKMDEPIQITRIEVGVIEVGSGVELQETVIARPMPVATGELVAQFPEPLPMPQLGFGQEGLWTHVGEMPSIPMPEPPPMPVIDWATVAPPVPTVPEIEDIPLAEKKP